MSDEQKKPPPDGPVAVEPQYPTFVGMPAAYREGQPVFSNAQAAPGEVSPPPLPKTVPAAVPFATPPPPPEPKFLTRFFARTVDATPEDSILTSLGKSIRARPVLAAKLISAGLAAMAAPSVIFFGILGGSFGRHGGNDVVEAIPIISSPSRVDAGVRPVVSPPLIDAAVDTVSDTSIIPDAPTPRARVRRPRSHPPTPPRVRPHFF